MDDSTYQKILKVIKECHWKIDMAGTEVCRGNCLPCKRCIDTGKCDAIIKILKGDKHD